MAPEPIVAQDLELFTDIVDVQASPALPGRVAVVTSRPDLTSNSYQRRVVVLDVTGECGAAQPLLDVAASLPRWAPDGPRLATVRSRDGRWEVVVHADTDTDGVVVCSSPDPIEELSWSPDGAWLLFVVREPADREWWQTPIERRPPLRLTRLRYHEDTVGLTVDRPRQAYLAPSSGGEPRRLSTGGFDDAEFAWHPDSTSVVFVSQRHDGRDRTLLNDVFAQPVAEGGEPVALTATQFCFGRPRVSPDGSTVAFTAIDVLNFPDNSELGTVAIGGGEPTILTRALDRDCAGGSWDGDGALLTLVDDAGATHCYRVPTDGAAPDLVLGGERRVGPLARSGDALVFATLSPTEPARLVVRRADGAERTVFAPNAPAAAARELRAPTRRTVGTAPGVTVDSWLTLPDAERWPAPHPLIVCLQGGGTQYGYQWSQEFQLLNAAGFATLCLNARGSAGYGRDWARAVTGPAAPFGGTGWGVDDIDDVATVVRETLSGTAELDPARVGVQGGSYGALVTTWLLARTDLFRAGWAERGPYNLYSHAGTNDESPWFFGTYLGRSQLDDPAAYWTPSPLRVAPSITAPLAIVHSERDLRCPIQQAEELFMALKMLDREVEFIRFPGESHELTRSGSPIHRLQRLELLLEWFGRHLA